MDFRDFLGTFAKVTFSLLCAGVFYFGWLAAILLTVDLVISSSDDELRFRCGVKTRSQLLRKNGTAQYWRKGAKRGLNRKEEKGYDGH